MNQVLSNLVPRVSLLPVDGKKGDSGNPRNKVGFYPSSKNIFSPHFRVIGLPQGKISELRTATTNKWSDTGQRTVFLFSPLMFGD